ncbi:uncharacterized protein LOC113465003 [Ceratina calcarata]|uniref:Uncharacterized protein LOC113465003 n=1 Tax=Ceratina calcarata TaxID=156304 RepID=A0AAJ7S9N3_9HYME|nr:uncharacterized protein LOC113465003 [Ceratina calcarata]
MPGYKGENIEPFCKKPNRRYCNPLFKNSHYVHQNCAPLYYADQSPQQDCSHYFECRKFRVEMIK